MSGRSGGLRGVVESKVAQDGRIREMHATPWGSRGWVARRGIVSAVHCRRNERHERENNAMGDWFPLTTPASTRYQVVDLCATPALLPPNHRAPWEEITPRRLPAPLAPTSAHALVRHG